MPPTLFALPDLNPRANLALKRAERAPESPLGAEPATAGPANAIPNASPAPPNAPPAGYPAPAGPEPEHAGAARPEASRNREGGQQRHEIPAGRGWMDALQQHGVVVMLLVLVIGTALWSERDRSLVQIAPPTVETAAESASAPRSAEVADIPLPPHTHERQSGVAVAVEPDSVSVPAVSGAALEQPDPVAPSARPPVSADIALSAPATGITPAAPADSSPTAGDPVSPSPAKTVANRMESPSMATLPRQVDAPTLEHLLADVERSETPQPQTAADRPSSSAPLFSRTPAGIADWTRYLPPLQSDASNRELMP